MAEPEFPADRIAFARSCAYTVAIDPLPLSPWATFYPVAG
jgi:hypothetical protein